MEQDFSIRSLLNGLIDFVYPPRCQICGTNFYSDNIWLCDKCNKTLKRSVSPYCPICHAHKPDKVNACPQCNLRSCIRWTYSLGIYEGGYDHLIKAFKFTSKPVMAKLLGAMVAEELAKLPHLRKINAICAIPIHYKKYRIRGFNQSELLAREIADKLQIDFYSDQLEQVVRNRDQIGLSLQERYENVRDIYRVTDSFELAGKKVLLVDDVTTSGATLDSAARELKSAGVDYIAATTIAVAFDSKIDISEFYQYFSEEF